MPYLLPMAFMMVCTLIAMGVKLRDFFEAGEWLLLFVGSCISTIALWLVVEAGLGLRRYARGGSSGDLEIPV